jgi:rhomboid family GlyGly-CTERM serine protease
VNRRLLVVALLVFAALLLPLLLPDPLQAALRYDRAALAAGEWWRLISAHVVHLGARHALLNAAAAGVLVLLFGAALSRWDWALTVVLSMLVLDAGLWFLSPRIEWYVGASGVLHGVIAAGALALLRLRDWRGALLLALLVGKLLFEQLTAGDLGFVAGLPVVVDAHLYGASGGALAFIGAYFVRKRALSP